MGKKKEEPKAPSVFEVINKRFGANTINQLSRVPAKQYDVISTGSIGLDHALGVGGLPRGRIVEIFGPESSGKTTLTLHVLAAAQKRGLSCAFIDAEHALDIRYAAALGVNVKDLWVMQPDYGEQALEVTDMLARSGAVGVIVVDSVAALTPKAEIEGEVGDYHVGVQARMMSQALRKLVGVTSNTKTMVIFINQLRMKIGVKFGSPETTTGGNALKFYASIRLDTRRIGGVKAGTAQVANRTRVRVKKNKVAPPFTECEFDIGFGKGIDRMVELIELGVAAGVIDKAGAWLSYNGERLGQGRAKAAAFLGDAGPLTDEIEANVREALTTVDAVALTTSKEDDEDEKPAAKKKKKNQSTSAADAVASLTKGAKSEPAS